MIEESDNIGSHTSSPEQWTDGLSPECSWTRTDCNRYLERSLIELSRHSHLEYTPPSVPESILYDECSKEIDPKKWDALLTCLAGRRHLNQPGFAVRRTDVRRWPSKISAFRTPTDREFDQFQETTLHTFEPLIIMSESSDEKWYLIACTTYIGWVLKQDVSECTWEQFKQYRNPSHFLVITELNVTTQPQPYDPCVSRQPVEFAAVLPLAEDTGPLGRQSNAGNIGILLPVRNNEGRLEVHRAFLRRTDGIHVGWQPFSRVTAVKTAFTLLAERYGWGGRLGSHDCSSFIMDVYRTMGIQIPRDANVQENGLPTRVKFTPSMTNHEREEELRELRAGDPLYMPGHTMLYLGPLNGYHYVIHDFAGYLNNGRYVPVNEVMVSTLELFLNDKQTYLQALTTGSTLFCTTGVDGL